MSKLNINKNYKSDFALPHNAEPIFLIKTRSKIKKNRVLSFFPNICFFSEKKITHDTHTLSYTLSLTHARTYTHTHTHTHLVQRVREAIIESVFYRQAHEGESKVFLEKTEEKRPNSHFGVSV